MVIANDGHWPALCRHFTLSVLQILRGMERILQVKKNMRDVFRRLLSRAALTNRKSRDREGEAGNISCLVLLFYVLRASAVSGFWLQLCRPWLIRVHQRANDKGIVCIA